MYQELKAPCVADDMVREWREKRPKPPAFKDLIDEARKKKKLMFTSKDVYTEAESFGFDTYWLANFGRLLVDLKEMQPNPNAETWYWYIPNSATIEDIRDSFDDKATWFANDWDKKCILMTECARFT